MAQNRRILDGSRVDIAIRSEMVTMVRSMVQFGRQAKQRESTPSVHGVTMDEPFTNRANQEDGEDTRRQRNRHGSQTGLKCRPSAEQYKPGHHAECAEQDVQYPSGPRFGDFRFALVH
jgi:hypothetical protein